MGGGNTEGVLPKDSLLTSFEIVSYTFIDPQSNTFLTTVATVGSTREAPPMQAVTGNACDRVIALREETY